MIYGRVDEMRGGKVFGWAFDSERPDDHLEISIRRSAQNVAAGRADVFREDLPAAGIGKGDHAFEIVLPPNISSFHGLVFTALSEVSGDAVLPIATNDERHLDDLFHVFSRRYDDALHSLKADVASLRETGPVPGMLADIEERILRLETRVEEMEVFIVRLDETSRRVQERIGLLRPQGFFAKLFAR